MKKIDTNQKIESAIRSGFNSEFWEYGMKPILNGWIKELEEDILDREELSQKIEITQRELLMLQRKTLLNLINAPQMILEDLKEGIEPKFVSPDPYPRNIKELNEMK